MPTEDKSEGPRPGQQPPAPPERAAGKLDGTRPNAKNRKTPAFGSFSRNLSKARRLLNAGLQGIEVELNKHKSILRKFGKTGLTKRTDEQLDIIIGDESKDINLERVGQKGKQVQFEMSERAAALIVRAMRSYSSVHEELNFDLHNVLCVYAWSAFEGYVQRVLWEIFLLHPQLLASDRSMTFQTIVDSKDDIIGCLVRAEIETVGRKSFRDLNAYLGTRLKSPIPNKYSMALEGIYFIRNIIAHTAGEVREEQIAAFPVEVDVADGKLRLSEKYLDEAMKCIENAVAALDTRLNDLYYNNSLTISPEGASRPIDLPPSAPIPEAGD